MATANTPEADSLQAMVDKMTPEQLTRFRADPMVVEMREKLAAEEADRVALLKLAFTEATAAHVDAWTRLKGMPGLLLEIDRTAGALAAAAQKAGFAGALTCSSRDAMTWLEATRVAGRALTDPGKDVADKAARLLKGK